MRNDDTWLSDQLAEMQQRGLLRQRRRVTPLPDGWCEVDGNRLLNFSSNDYLNLAHDGRVVAAAREALADAGVGARASALVTGRSEWHVRLEERLAEFEQQAAAILFPTGYAANLGTIPALVDSGDIVFSDRYNHASLIDGCRLSGARFRVYRHDDLSTLDRELAKATEFRRRLIVTDGVFSMDGDVAPLPELCDLAEQYDATLLIDEAHGTGVFGEHGRGAAEWLGVENRGAIRVGTLSKAVGTLGGFVTGSHALIDWLWNRARTNMYSTALPPSVCAAACTALDIIESEPERRTTLHRLAADFREQVKQAGLECPANSIGPIVPIILNEPDVATAAAAELESLGFLVAAIRPPTVPAGTSRLRITLSCAHTAADLGKLADAVSDVIAHPRRLP